MRTVVPNESGASEPALRVEDLTVSFRAPMGVITPVRGVSFKLERGARAALVGESGSGKSLTALALMRLIPEPVWVTGQAWVQGIDVLTLKERDMASVRGRRIAMIYQDPLSALNPIQSIGKQISEALAVHGFGSGRELKLRSLTMLEEVGFPSPKDAYQSYPHQLSGGMRQRAMIAMALCPGPDILIADEPTTALDVTTQARIVALLRNISEERKTALILITHDLGVAAGLCDEIHVMYAGRIVESARSVPLYTAPAHPYTEGLLAATLRLDADEREAPFTIPGQPPAPEHLPSGCAFHPRCHHSQELCRTTAPPQLVLQGDRRSECHFAEEVLLKHADQPPALSPRSVTGDWRD